ncbi:MAG: hypothetical protein Q7K03_03410 [Dehalococcoidia bacterium]|nr:hypothetical protein [Dehalococcoidia bacterium]
MVNDNQPRRTALYLLRGVGGTLIHQIGLRTHVPKRRLQFAVDVPAVVYQEHSSIGSIP